MIYHFSYRYYLLLLPILIITTVKIINLTNERTIRHKLHNRDGWLSPGFHRHRFQAFSRASTIAPFEYRCFDALGIIFSTYNHRLDSNPASIQKESTFYQQPSVESSLKDNQYNNLRAIVELLRFQPRTALFFSSTRGYVLSSTNKTHL